MTIYELTPTDSRKSFYGKCHVKVDDNRVETLYSYDTPVLRKYPDGKIVRLWNGWSATTGRHVAAYCGLNKAGYVNLDMEEIVS